MSFLAAFINRQFISEPPVPTTSFENRTVIVTGSSSGLGLEASRKIVQLGASQVILACRNLEKANTAAKDIQSTTGCSSDALQVWQLDMSSYASVCAFADRVNTELPRLDALIANAGIMCRDLRKTEDNDETITTNVISTTLLAFLIHPKLHETATRYGTRTNLTFTGSELYEVAKFKERKAPEGKIFEMLNEDKKPNMGERYNLSKLLVMFAMKQLSEMAPASESGVIVNCVAPGFCMSGLARDYESIAARAFIRMLARPTEVGARTLVGGASAGIESHGQYMPDCKITPTVGLTKGKEGRDLQERVWKELNQKLLIIRPGVTTLSHI